MQFIILKKKLIFFCKDNERKLSYLLMDTFFKHVELLNEKNKKIQKIKKIL